ncbi:hypothetical protein Bca4012_058011 [Brassica carinata]
MEEFQSTEQKQAQEEEEEDELRKLLLSDIGELPISPPSATQINFVSYFITDFTKPFVFEGHSASPEDTLSSAIALAREWSLEREIDQATSAS